MLLLSVNDNYNVRREMYDVQRATSNEQCATSNQQSAMRKVMSKMSDETTLPTKGSSAIPGKTMMRAVLTVMVSALLTGGLFSLFYIAVFNAPEPHELPIAVAGISATGLQEQSGNQYKLIQVSDQAAGLAQLNRHDVYGVIQLDGAQRTVVLSYTSVDGSSVLAYMQPLAAGIARSAGMTLKVRNTTPEVAANATPGRSVFFAVFGTALTGFVLSQALSSLAKKLRLSLRARLGIMLLVSVIAGLFVALLLDPWYGIAPGTFWSALPMLALLCMSAVVTGTALLEAVGPLGQVITAVLFITLGNATATGILPMPFLSPSYQVVSRILPTGNVVRAVLSSAYFEGAGQFLGYLVPLIWVAVGALALVGLDRRRGADSRG
jgi:hypothetical protein